MNVTQRRFQHEINTEVLTHLQALCYTRGVTPLYNHTGTCRNLGYTFCTLQSGFSGRFGTLSTCSGFLGMFSIVCIHKSQKRFTFIDERWDVRIFGLIISSPSGFLDYIQPLYPPDFWGQNGRGFGTSPSPHR